MKSLNCVFSRNKIAYSFWTLVACVFLLGFGTVPEASAQTSVSDVEIVDQDPEGIFGQITESMINFQRKANAQIATHMNAIEQGTDLGAFFLALLISLTYGMIHAFGPGHGKFIIISYFMGREVRVTRGIVMALQLAIVHVIAAVIVVWLADIVLKAGFGIGLAEVPGVRAGSFLIIVGIGIYMLYQAICGSLASAGGNAGGHGHGHGHGHSHGYGHSHGHGGNTEGGILALAAGMVPCPGAVLIMLYAVANDMIYPGFLLVAAMSAGIGLAICSLGVGSILARQTAIRVVERSGGARGVNAVRQIMNYGGAIFVTLIGLFSFLAFLDVPLGYRFAST